jgi:sugar lactone lactonase YvrE
MEALEMKPSSYNPFYKWLILLPIGLSSAHASAARPDFPAYNVSVWVHLAGGSLLNVEGLARSEDTGQLYATRYYNGTIFSFDSAGNRETLVQFDPSIVGNLTGIKINDQGDVIFAFHSVDGSLNPTVYNGIWKATPGASCTSLNGTTCKKLFPRGENVYFPDGVAIHKSRVYVSDPARDNIWTFKDEGVNTQGTLMTGTDAGSAPNFLEGFGFFFPPGSEFNRFGRGFGVNGLAIDKKGDVLYAANADRALVVKIPVTEGVAGTQQVLFSKTFQYLFDGIFAGNDKVYVTAVADVTSGGVTAGNKVFAADFKKSGNFALILDDPLLGTPTDVVDGCNFSGEGDECSTLYVTDIGAPGVSPFGPNIIKATPAN